MKPVFLFLLSVFASFFFAACSLDSLFGGAVTQLSQAITNKNLTEDQKEDLMELARELHAYTQNDESCSTVRNALDENKTILYLEENYKLKPFFIHEEFLRIDSKTVITSAKSRERFFALSILNLWKERATEGQLEAIILKIRKCYPDT